MRSFAELHVHIEGTLEAELLVSLARRNEIALPTYDAEALRTRYVFDDLQGFLDIYFENLAVMQTEADFHDLGIAYLRRASQAGVRHAEIFFDPQQHLVNGVPIEAVFGGLTSAIDEARRDLDVSGDLILCFLRDRGGEAATEMLRKALPFRDRFIGVGLDSTEIGFPPELFADAFELAGAEGLHRVAHAGEEGGPEAVRAALDVLHVERIDHGNRSLEDADLVERLRDERIPLTVCPLSNIALKTAPPNLADHPLPRMLDEGLLVTLGSDDPAYFGGYLDDTVRAAIDDIGLSEATIDLLARNSFEASFLPTAAKERYLDGLRAP